MTPVSSPTEPVVIDTTGEEVPPSLRPRRPKAAPVSHPAPRPANVVPFASTLRHLSPDAVFVPVIG